MNRAEKELVGVFLKFMIRQICRTFPYDEEIRFGTYPYPEKLMNARKGARFLLQGASGYEFVGGFMMRFEKLVKPLGNILDSLPHGGELLVDSTDLPDLVGGCGELPDDTLRQTFSSYFHTMNQYENWPHLTGCYEELMRSAAKAGYVEDRKLDTATVKEDFELRKEGTKIGLSVHKALSSDQLRSYISRWDYQNEKEMYDLFDREYGTTDGVIRMWSSKVTSLFGPNSMQIDPTYTGGPYN